MIDVPFDLRPLGLVHNHESAETLMARVREQYETGKITLWGYSGQSTPYIQALPPNCVIEWMGTPADTDDYYCEVSAFPRPRAEKQQQGNCLLLHAWENMLEGRPPGYSAVPIALYHKGIQETWFRLRIRREDLDRLVGIVTEDESLPETPLRGGAEAFPKRDGDTEVAATENKPARKRRRDEKRPEISIAIAELRKLDTWNAKAKQRCRLVETYLHKPPGWCTVETLRRAATGLEGGTLALSHFTK